MCRQASQKDDLSEFETGIKGFKGLLHRLDGDL